MRLTVRCMLVVLLLVSATVDSYDQESQRFVPTYGDSQTDQNYRSKNVRFFLSPGQAQTLEKNGYVLRADQIEPVQQHPTEDDEEEHTPEEYDHNVSQQQTEITEHKPREILELEEILRVLNKQIEEDDKQTDGRGQVSQIEEDDGEDDSDDEEEYEQLKSRIQQTNEQKYRGDEQKHSDVFQKIPARFGVLQRYITPSGLSAQYEQQFSTVVTNQQKPVHFQQEADKKFEPRQEDNMREIFENILTDLRNKVIIAEHESSGPEEILQDDSRQKVDSLQSYYMTLPPISSNRNIAQFIKQQRAKPTQDNLKILREFQHVVQDPRYDRPKYIVGVERSRANLEPRRSLTRAEVIAKLRPFLREEQIDTDNIQIDNNRNVLSARVNFFPDFAVRSPQKFTPLQITRSTHVPVIKRSRIELKRAVPLDSENQGSVLRPRKVFVSKNNPYLTRIDPEYINNQLISTRKHV